MTFAQKLLACAGAISLAICMFSQSAKATCNPQLDQSITADWLADGYNSFDQSQRSQSFDITIANIGTSECRLLLGIYSEFGPTQLRNASNTLDYILSRAGETRSFTTDGLEVAYPTNTISLVIPAEDSRRVELNFTIPARQVVAPGTYIESLEIRLFSEDGSISLETAQMRLTADVVPTASVSFGGASVSSEGLSRYFLDLGDLRSGLTTESRPVMLHVRSNSDYEIEFRSENNGQLRRKDSSQGWFIDYDLFLDSILMLSGNASASTQRSIISQSGGEMLPLTVKVGNVENQRAGIYRDRVTITVTPVN